MTNEETLPAACAASYKNVPQTAKGVVGFFLARRKINGKRAENRFHEATLYADQPAGYDHSCEFGLREV